MSFILNSCNSSSSGHRCCGNANQGSSVAISADGNTSVVGRLADNSYAGAIWIFVP